MLRKIIRIAKEIIKLTRFLSAISLMFSAFGVGIKEERGTIKNQRMVFFMPIIIHQKGKIAEQAYTCLSGCEKCSWAEKMLAEF